MASEVPPEVHTQHQLAAPRIPLRPRNLAVYLVYLVGFFVLVLMTFMEHKPAQPDEPTEWEPPEFWSTDFWYERVVGAADPRDIHVAVITVGRDMPKVFPLIANAQAPENRGETSEAAKAEVAPLPESCRRRLYISELLKALAKHYPKVVVLDIWLDPELCTNKQVNDTLSSELTEFSEHAPMILGVPARGSVDLQAESPAEFTYMKNRTPAFKPAELVVMPVTHLSRANNGRITEALIRRDSNTRRIPLGWPVYVGFPEVGSSVRPEMQDTLSVAAVRAFDPHHSVLKKIDALAPDGSPQVSTAPYPYTNFLRENELPIERSIEVICLSSPDEAWKAICAGTRVFGATPGSLNSKSDSLKDKIVIIGIVGLGDLHPTVLGRVPNVILQANYIQSLLNSRVYKPLSIGADLIVEAILLVVVFTIAWRFRRNTFLALAVSILATIVGAFVILKFLTWAGYYTNLVVPLAAAAVITNITVQFHHFLLHQGGTQ